MPPGARSRRFPATGTALACVCLAMVVTVAFAPPAAATPFIWDEDTDRIDDRIETVNVLGYRFSFEAGDTLQRQRIAVARVGPALTYSAYVVFDHAPDSKDLAALSAIGMPVLARYEGVPAVRTLATYPQLDAAAALGGVERIEAVQVLYPSVRDATAAMGVRDPTGQVFPTWEGTGGADGSGVVVAILDTGVNDAPFGNYPGHESLAGRCLGGAQFVYGDSALDTPRDGSVNPVDQGGVATDNHGTHVASLILGSGGASGYAVGVAPGARFVDVKVLNDAGSGTGVADGLDWCIHNRARAWGGPAGYDGVDVINLSLSSPDHTDGNDVVSRLANRASELGMVVVASMGNDGLSAHVPSPAGGDRVLAVGAFDDQRSPRIDDDAYATFDNAGPRASDGDADAADEQKPDLLAPGVSVLGADGDLSSDGAQYVRLSGTSMAAALVSGAAALLRSNNPGLEPDAIAGLLRATARRTLGGSPPAQGGVDPRWSSGIGFGALDLYAARLELEQPATSQVVGLALRGAGDSIDVTLRTQRELGAAAFVIERAADMSGMPGAFAAVDSVPAAGDPSLADPVNRTLYSRSWAVPMDERGAWFWYRGAFTEGGVRHEGPARRFQTPSGSPAATFEVTIVHNAYDHDVTARVGAGGAFALWPTSSTSELEFPMPGTGAAVSSDWADGTAETGNVAWNFRVDVPHGAADAYLPPTPDKPWRLDVDEAGYVNRAGRVTAYRLIWHAPSGDQVFDGGPLPEFTAEGQTTTAWIPVQSAGVGSDGADVSLRFGPNPVTAGRAVEFTLPADASAGVSIYDVTGRQVGRATALAGGSMRRARWETRTPAGQPVPAGVYFARWGRGAVTRLVVLSP